MTLKHIYIVLGLVVSSNTTIYALSSLGITNWHGTNVSQKSA